MKDIFGTDGIQIFKNRASLSPRHLPDRLVGREKQVKELASLMRPVLHQGEPANVLISGIKGTGKTTIVRFILKQLSANIEKKDSSTVGRSARPARSYSRC
ncbi:MAG: AAA family ATPase [Methanococcoides sp.]|nr:AAA family ATPase [Methanococcoides sp.]